MVIGAAPSGGVRAYSKLAEQLSNINVGIIGGVDIHVKIYDQPPQVDFGSGNIIGTDVLAAIAAATVKFRTGIIQFLEETAVPVSTGPTGAPPPLVTSGDTGASEPVTE
jgi:hypothetical protein